MVWGNIWEVKSGEQKNEKMRRNRWKDVYNL